jgi:hypothetical protein
MAVAARNSIEGNDIEEALDVIADFLRLTSTQLAGELFQCPEGAESFDPPRTELVFAEKMALVFVAGPALRILFRVHYEPSFGSHVASALDDTTDEVRISDAYTAQLMQEYTNLVAGRCKSMLDGKEVETGLSLPLTTGGIDEVFFRHMKGSPFMRNLSWCVKPRTGLTRLTISISVEILDPSVVDQIRQESVGQTQQSSGELDLF